MFREDVPAKIYRDEIFEYQDLLSECKCFDEVYNLCDEILWELECRLTPESEFMQELEKIHKEVENGNYERFSDLK